MESSGTYELNGRGFGINVFIYLSLYELIAKKSRKLACSVPDFIVKETLKHFEKGEQYEKCSTIKSFFDQNPSRLFPMSRTDWMDHGWQAVRTY